MDTYSPGLTRWQPGSPVTVRLLDGSSTRGRIVKTWIDDSDRSAFVKVGRNDLGSTILVRRIAGHFIQINL